jgi:hypothetical protein
MKGALSIQINRHLPHKWYTTNMQMSILFLATKVCTLYLRYGWVELGVFQD